MKVIPLRHFLMTWPADFVGLLALIRCDPEHPAPEVIREAYVSG